MLTWDGHAGVFVNSGFSKPTVREGAQGPEAHPDPSAPILFESQLNTVGPVTCDPSWSSAPSGWAQGVSARSALS